MATTTAIRRPVQMPVETGRLASCGCGQPLDAYDAGHCPRCGVTLATAHGAEAK